MKSSLLNQVNMKINILISSDKEEIYSEVVYDTGLARWFSLLT